MSFYESIEQTGDAPQTPLEELRSFEQMVADARKSLGDASPAYQKLKEAAEGMRAAIEQQERQEQPGEASDASSDVPPKLERREKAVEELPPRLTRSMGLGRSLEVPKTTEELHAKEAQLRKLEEDMAEDMVRSADNLIADVTRSMHDLPSEHHSDPTKTPAFRERQVEINLLRREIEMAPDEIAREAEKAYWKSQS